MIISLKISIAYNARNKQVNTDFCIKQAINSVFWVFTVFTIPEIFFVISRKIAWPK